MRKVRILPLIRKATIVPKTLNKEARTVDVIFSTGERIKRTRFFEDDVFEELALGTKNVRLDRLNKLL